MNNLSAVESIFFAALDKGSPQERAAYLDEACSRDPAMRASVERMLGAHPRVGSFLQAPAPGLAGTVDEQPITEKPGSIIGPYKLMEQIGEGGMGLVFVAEQQQPIRRKVALKIIKPGMDTRQVIARFEAERQALALMDHPNIAKVLDAGTTESGLPYFVMELVKGVPITDYCVQNQLAPRERLGLFAHICQAVQHASPFAFTGNRFEFRAPGSLQSIAGPMVTINTILAEALDYLATEIETLVEEGTEFNVAVQKVLEEVITVHGGVVYNGDGYTEEWQIEAAARGLPNLRTTLDALPELITDDAMALFSHYGVFSDREMHSRYDIALEQYILSVGVEARLTLEIANTVILPAAVRYQTELATNLATLKSIDVDGDSTTLNEVSASITSLRAGISTLRSELGGNGAMTVLHEAQHAQNKLLPAMSSTRAAADELESLVADDLWPLATYQEMLFIL